MRTKDAIVYASETSGWDSVYQNAITRGEKVFDFPSYDSSWLAIKNNNWVYNNNGSKSSDLWKALTSSSGSSPEAYYTNSGLLYLAVKEAYPDEDDYYDLSRQTYNILIPGNLTCLGLTSDMKWKYSWIGTFLRNATTKFTFEFVFTIDSSYEYDEHAWNFYEALTSFRLIREVMNTGSAWNVAIIPAVTTSSPSITGWCDTNSNNRYRLATYPMPAAFYYVEDVFRPS